MYDLRRDMITFTLGGQRMLNAEQREYLNMTYGYAFTREWEWM